MNRDTFPGTNPCACTSALADDIADRIALAGHPAELDEVVKGMWGHHFAGALTEAEVEALDEAARARREALQEPRTETRPLIHRKRDVGRERALAAKRGAKRAIRATKRAAEWRKDLHRAHGYLRSRAGEEEGRALDAELEQRLAEGPDFARYRGGSDFRDAPVLHLDRNAIAKIKTACHALDAAEWKDRAKGKHGGATPARCVLEALLWLSRPGKGLCLSYEAIAEAAHYCRRTIADALQRLKRLGLITIHRRLKRIKTALGFKVVQDWNAYELHPPGVRLGPLFEGLRSECKTCAAKEPLFHFKSEKESVPPPWGVPDGVFSYEEAT
jgi:hypothetical protein